MNRMCVHRFRICALGICLVLPLSVRAEDPALKLAAGLLEIGNYDEAITEYKRFICFNSGDERVSDAYSQIGIAYRNQAQWERALDAFRKSFGTAPNDTLRDERRVHIGMVLIAGQDYGAAEFELLRVFMFSQDPSVRRKAAFFLGVCHVYTFKWEEARKAFAQYFDSYHMLQHEQVDSLLAPAHYPKHKSPDLAKWLSTFVPGSGQIYAGNFSSGLNALGINLGMGYLLARSLLEQRYQDAFIAYLSLFWRYYSGNRYNAERMARECNEQWNRRYSRQVLDLISGVLSE